MTNNENRLAALEAENMRLTSELAALQPRAAPPKLGARTYHHILSFTFATPSEEELRLHRILIAANPVIEQKVGRSDHSVDPFRSFMAEFAAVGRIGRTAEPVDNVRTNFFVDFCDRLFEGSHTVMHSEFWAAVVVHGNSAFRPLEHIGWAPGLEHRVDASRPPVGDARCRVLAAGQAQRPTHSVREVRQWTIAVPHVPSW